MAPFTERWNRRPMLMMAIPASTCVHARSETSSFIVRNSLLPVNREMSEGLHEVSNRHRLQRKCTDNAGDGIYSTDVTMPSPGSRITYLQGLAWLITRTNCLTPANAKFVSSFPRKRMWIPKMKGSCAIRWRIPLYKNPKHFSNANYLVNG